MTARLYAVMKLSEKIAKAMEYRNVIKAELARESGVDSARVSRWISGELKPSVHKLLLIARYLEIPMEFFVDEEMTEIPRQGGLSRDERKILDAAQTVGYELALRRIMNGSSPSARKVPEPVPAKPKSPEERKAEEEARDKAQELAQAEADEFRTASLVQVGANLEKGKKLKQAIAIYRDVIKTYPDAPSTQKARDRLKALKLKE